MIAPTIGRQVWYYPTMFERRLSDQPFAATVVYVHSDHYVSLVTLGHRGESVLREHVRLIQDDESVPEEKGHCEWMPYQKGQAKALDLNQLPLNDLVFRSGTTIGKTEDIKPVMRDPYFG